MTASLARTAMAALLLASATARADHHRAIGVSIEECAERASDRAELAARIAVELGVPPGEVALEDEEAPIRVRVRASCDTSEVQIEVHQDGRVLARRADLGDTTGVGRAWALALLVSELVRDARAGSAPEGATASAAPAQPAAVPQAIDDERPFARAAPRTAPSTRIGAGAYSCVYVDIPTFAFGLELAVSHEWLRVALAGFGTQASSALGAIHLGAAIVEVAVRPLAWTDGTVALSGELSVSGGVAYASGRAGVPGVAASDAVDAIAGAGLAARGGWRATATLFLEAALAVGYDLVGPTYESSEQPIAALRGLRVGLTVAIVLGL